MRTAKELRPTSVVTFMSQRREAVEEAYAGDIIGFTTHGGVQLGDTITDGANLQFTGLPFFAPEMFMTVVLKNPLRTKQLAARAGAAGRRRRDSGVQARDGRQHAAGRGGPVAV
jgi:peptide subunit release factor RF-3